MKNKFKIKLIRFKNLTEIPGRRSAQDYLALLELMEFSDIAEIAPEELEEMCLMSLQDLDPVEAAELILKFDLGKRLKDGQIKNIANEMLDEKLWEEYADPAMHEGLFNVGSLLYKAFPKSFPLPDAVAIELEILPTNEASKNTLEKHLTESLVVRMIADDMDEHSILKRLFEDQLKGRSFPEAESIIWTLSTSSTDDNITLVKIISSGYWLDALRDSTEYESSAYPDGDES
ncbi:MAG: hypothetical protein K9K67_15005 [Bacteriovoracaceae bacterium]|nr:hypothetical protein [Bacteriovoracaceae bacterium]